MSTFDENDEGWRIVSVTNLPENNYSVVGTYLARHVGSGGSPGGYISTTDPDGG